jgi:hypothetical protein
MNRLLSTLIALALCAAAVSAQDAKRKAQPAQPTYQFEAEPRPVLQPNGVETSKHPKLYLRTSTLYLLAVHGNGQLALGASGDGGDTFEPPVPISSPGAQVSSHGENSPTLAINGIEFYALWEQNNAQGGTDLMFARSLRFGRKFDAPIKVTDKEKPSGNAFSHLAVAPNGDLYAAWLDGRNPQGTMPGTSHVYLAKSTDKGATFGKNIPLTKNVCPCCRPTVAFGANGEVFVSWRGVAEGDVRDIFVATSTDGGQTFSAPVRVAADNWKISGCPHSGASMALKGKRLYVAWHSEGDGTNAGVRLAWSDDGGKTFARPVIASGNILDTNHPALSVSEDGRVLMVFKGRDPVAKESWGPVSPYLVEVNDNGTLTAPLVVPGNRKSISYPVVVAGTVGRAYIAWSEGTGNGLGVMLTRARRTSAQAERRQPSAGKRPATAGTPRAASPAPTQADAGQTHNH